MLKVKSEEVREQALAALSGMSEVARNDMLERGYYLSNEVVNPELADRGAICGGRQACAVGSLWLGAGVKMNRNRQRLFDILPGTDPGEREGFLSRRPGLKLAYEAMNQASARYCERNGIDLDEGAEDEYGDTCGYVLKNGRKRMISTLSRTHGEMECLFEATYYDTERPILDLSEMPKIIKSAREAIRRAQVTA